MKIDEAIEVNQSLLDGTYDHRDDTMGKALQLGIEALKRIVYLRLDMDCPHWMTLPSETEGIPQ